ncbi:histidine kinase dimerization/phospho-acceptor domain-containing protein [uncultured Psychrosphaera sp.]|uniref:histidine kinase dimerization/phospho-acceptor domain-containing protein n=1 Tax=uncultured Psychrosphaera sp. TaxID=1403522 RepID=UPI002620C531|nr:histidine kinase dimerization/phospho-acceptor domain-containing protein [uncultured Psychrosphaera sp.]
MNSAMYETFFNHSNDILFITDDKGNLLDINTTFVHNLGYSKKQVLLTNIKPLMHQDDVTKTLKLMSELSRDKPLINFEQNYIHLNGKSLRLSCTAFMDVETRNIFISAKYISKNSNEEINKFVNATAHEINNPLGIISGYTELLKSQPGIDKNTNEKLDVILKSSERIANTIKDLKQVYCSDSSLEK